MKRMLPSLKLPVLALLLFILSGCMKDNITRRFTILTPVFEDKAKVLANMSSVAPIPVKTPGKIFIYGRYIFLNEVDAGVHIIDNSDPASPKPVAFIEIPGNIDIAVKGNILYADMYRDLLVFDISDPLKAKLKTYVANIMPERYYPGNISNDSSKVIVGWETRDTIVDVDLPNVSSCWNCMYASGGDAMPNKAHVPGIAGSMARFSVVNNFLYVVNSSSLNVLDISVPDAPEKKGVTNIGWGIETIYPFANKLFIGSNAGMYIYDITEPATPKAEGKFEHARACDPVVTDGQYAYVTLRSGNACAGFNNQLDVIDVTDVNNPSLVKTYPFTNPHGLAKDGDILFVCDGIDGVKIFDARDVHNLKMIEEFDNINAFDVIVWNNRALIAADDGIYQFDYNDTENIRLISTFKTK